MVSIYDLMKENEYKYSGWNYNIIIQTRGEYEWLIMFLDKEYFQGLGRTGCRTGRADKDDFISYREYLKKWNNNEQKYFLKYVATSNWICWEYKEDNCIEDVPLTDIKQYNEWKSKTDFDRMIDIIESKDYDSTSKANKRNDDLVKIRERNNARSIALEKYYDGINHYVELKR